MSVILSAVFPATAGGFWVAAPNGWGLKPERTTQYELGFSQQISDFASFDVTAFYKDIRDQIQFEQVAVASRKPRTQPPRRT